jgi:rod shape-determining protein MreD
MSKLLKNTIRFLLFILVQVFVLFQMKPLHQFIVPYLYFLYILWLPFNTPRLGLTLIGFLFGLTLDYFTKTPGLHAAPCTLIAYLRPFLINILIRQEGAQRLSCIFGMDRFWFFHLFSGESISKHRSKYAAYLCN